MTALDAGADDYLTKPFGNRTYLPRYGIFYAVGAARRWLRVSNVVRSPSMRHITAQVTGEPVRLARTEHTLLKSLMQRAPPNK